MQESTNQTIYKPAAETAPRKWTVEEDNLLRAAVEENGAKHWKAIAKVIKTRDHSQCLQRWSKTLAPGIRKGRWMPSEDEKLCQLFHERGPDWGSIALQISGRTSKQCRQRWCFQLDPALKKTAFTEEEDAVLLGAYERVGSSWAKIAAFLKGRTADSVKVRHKSLKRQEQRKENKENVQMQTASKSKKRTFEEHLDLDTALEDGKQNVWANKRTKTMQMDQISEFLKDLDLEDDAFFNDINALLDTVTEPGMDLW